MCPGNVLPNVFISLICFDLLLTADRPRALPWKGMTERDEKNDIMEWSSSSHLAVFIRLVLPFILQPAPILPLCSIPPLAAFEVAPLQVQNAVSWESGEEEGRGKTPTASKGSSWVVGRWGLFIARWCPLKRLSWRWRRRADREMLSNSRYCHTALQSTKEEFIQYDT